MKLNKKDIDEILGPIPKFTTKKYYFSNRGIRINSVGEYNCPVCGGTGRLVCDGEFCDPVEVIRWQDMRIVITVLGKVMVIT